MSCAQMIGDSSTKHHQHSHHDFVRNENTICFSLINYIIQNCHLVWLFSHYSPVFKRHTPTLPSAHPLSMGLPDPLKARPGNFQSYETSQHVKKSFGKPLIINLWCINIMSNIKNASCTYINRYTILSDILIYITYIYNYIIIYKYTLYIHISHLYTYKKLY